MALNSIPEGNGSVLDNTLVVYWNNCSDAVNHGSMDMPVVGGKFLKLQDGRFLQFRNRYMGNVSNMSDLWVQAAQAWGYSALTQYGAARWNQGPMPGVYGSPRPCEDGRCSAALVLRLRAPVSLVQRADKSASSALRIIQRPCGTYLPGWCAMTTPTDGARRRRSITRMPAPISVKRRVFSLWRQNLD